MNLVVVGGGCCGNKVIKREVTQKLRLASNAHTTISFHEKTSSPVVGEESRKVAVVNDTHMLQMNPARLTSQRFWHPLAPKATALNLG